MSDQAAKRQDDRPGEAARQLLEFLVCPLTHTTLEYDRQRKELVSRAARLAFPIRNGVPIMLVSEARKLKK